jgi:hypothetical protein
MEWTFKRGLSKPFVDALNDAYGRDHWWKEAAEDKNVIPAIRDEYLNVYYKGNSLWKVKRGVRGLGVSTHVKYLVRSNGSDYVSSTVDAAGQLRPMRDNISLVSISTLSNLKPISKTYTSEEKSGVHKIALNHYNVIDLEIAFTTEAAAEDKGQPVLRLDLAALVGKDSKPILVFFEAKRFQDPRLWSKSRPEVVAQMALYEELLGQHRDALIQSYRTVCGNLLRLHGVHNQSPERREILTRAETNGVEIETKPSLLIFGYDDANAKSDRWKKQRKLLVEILGKNRVLAAGSANNIRLPK